MYQSTKKFGPITTTHRNWKAAYNNSRDSVKCSYIHGYSRYAEITFEGELDANGWVFDFGNTKEIKDLLEENWDHCVLINNDDPKLSTLQEMHDQGLICLRTMDVSQDHGAGIEGSCKWLYDKASEIVEKITHGRVNIVRVQVWEHEKNSAVYIPK